jgi:AraC-like DNA-binding protein
LAGVVTLCQEAHIARDSNDDLTLFVSLTGKPAMMEVPDRRHGRHEALLQPHAPAFLKSNEERCSTTFSGCDSLVISVPRNRVIPAVADLDDALYRGVPQSAALNLLTGYATTLTSNIGPFTPEISAQAKDMLCDLLILALGPTRDGADAARCRAQAARLAAIKTDINANLGYPGFSLEWLARRHAVRPRTIQNLFYAAGESFSKYACNARLDHARAALADPENCGRSIAEIAFASGFGDISWFNNSFKKRYGMTPSDIRMAAVATHKNDAS